MKLTMTAAVAAGVALAASAVTRYWNPTTQTPQTSGSATMRYFWSTAANWLDENGNTGVPQAGDDVVFNRSGQVWGSSSAALNSLTLAPGSGQYPINQTTLVFPGGCKGFQYLITAYGNSDIYSIFMLKGDGDVPVYVPVGKIVNMQKAIRQNGTQGTDYAEGATLVKRRAGSFGVADSQWTDS